MIRKNGALYRVRKHRGKRKFLSHGDDVLYNTKHSVKLLIHYSNRQLIIMVRVEHTGQYGMLPSNSTSGENVERLTRVFLYQICVLLQKIINFSANLML